MLHFIEIFLFSCLVVRGGWGKRDNCPDVKPMKDFNIFQVSEHNFCINSTPVLHNLALV